MNMHYGKVGNSGLAISGLVLGSWKNIGERLDLAQSANVVAAAFDEGINTFDTADVYGAAEETLGRILGDYARQDFAVISKCFWPTGDGPNGRGLSRKHIRASVDRSLSRLKMDYLDIFMCHRFDPETPLEETISSFNDLIRQGRILHWAVSQWPAEQIIATFELCRKRGWEPPVIDQSEYSLLCRKRVELDLRDTVDATGISVMGWSPLASGILAGRAKAENIAVGSLLGTVSPAIREKYTTDDAMSKAKALDALAHSCGLSIVDLSLGWLVGRGKAQSLVIGVSSEDQIRKTVRSAFTTISDDVAAEIEAIFPQNGVLL